MRVLRSDFTRFALAKGVSWDCPSCGPGRLWNVNGLDTVNDMLTSMTFSPPPAAREFSYQDPERRCRPFVEVTCTNCGYLRLYNYYFLMEWTVANPDPAPLPQLQGLQP